MSDKPRILVSINAAWNIYNFRRTLIKRLQDEGYEVITAAPDDDYTARLEALVEKHYHLPMSSAGTSPISDFLLFCRYVKLLRRIKPSVMLGYTIKPNIYGSLACGLLGIPVINNVSGLGTVFIRRNWTTLIAKTLYRQALRFSSCVFFQNSEDKNIFINEALVEPSKTELIPGSGIDLDYFQPREEPIDASIRFLLVARMLWDKGVGEYVEAAHMVKQRYPDAAFQLLGAIGVSNKTAISKAQIEAWQAEGVVEYLGETDDVREQIAECHALVLPSYREGMSRALLEGLAMGRPLIATDVPGCNNTIDVGKNGLLCQLKDSESLAEQMMSFIELTDAQRHAMGKASRQKAEAEFDQKIVLDAYVRKVKAVT